MYTAIKDFIKIARATKVTISKDGKSWTFPSIEAAARYFSTISSFSKTKIMDLIGNRSQYICGFYIEYHE